MASVYCTYTLITYTVVAFIVSVASLFIAPARPAVTLEPSAYTLVVTDADTELIGSELCPPMSTGPPA